MTHRLLDLDSTAAVLRRGGVVLMPSDTVPGLHCRADHPVAIERLREMKQRPADKPLLLLCADAHHALTLAIGWTDREGDYARRLWPGPFTFIFRAAPEVADAVTGGASTVALRVPDLPVLCRLIAAVGAPLVSTSANESGGPPLSESAAAALFGDGLDGLTGSWLEPSSGAAGGEAMTSALVDLTCWPPNLLRSGPRNLP